MSSSLIPSSVTRKEIWAWCLYDFSNSAYTTVIVTVAYSVYFMEVVASGHNPEAWWGRGYALSMILGGLLSPFLGALADYSASRKRFLIFFTIMTLIPTALLVTVRQGDILLGIGLFVAANISYNSALSLYDSFLKDLSNSSNIGRISGYGWALGYIGGLLALLMVYPLIQGGFSPENNLAYRLSFPMTAAFYLVFSIPTFLYLKERGRKPLPGEAVSYWNVGFQRIRQTFREIRRFKQLLKYFIAYVVYSDGIHTIIVFSAIFAVKVLGFTPKELVLYFIVMQVSSALGAYSFAFITDRLGPKRTILITLLIWIGIVGWAYGVQTKAEFYLIGLTAGLALGSCQSASRTLLGLFTPPGRSAEFFGFFALTGKVAATLGPLVFGEIVGWTGSMRLAVLSIGVFFVVGIAGLLTVRERDGIEAAREV